MTNELSLLSRVEKKYQTDVFYYEGPLTQGGARRLRDSIDGPSLRYANVLLILESTEGSVEAAWQVINALKGRYGDHQLILYVPHLCTGPGALLAVAADTIIMDDAGRIGKISGSLNGDVLSAKNALNGLKILRSELNDVELAAAALGQVDLRVIGKQDREMRLAREYAARWAPFDSQQLAEKLLGEDGGSNPLFDSADLSLWTNVVDPSDALVDFASFIKADTMQSGLPAPHAMSLRSGRRVPGSTRERSGLSRAGGNKAA